MTWPTGKRTGIDYLGTAFSHDLSDGVRHELVNVMASREVVIWETSLHNPPEDPFHCPPGALTASCGYERNEPRPRALGG